MSKIAKITVLVTVTAGIAFLGLLGGGRHERAKARKQPDPMLGYYPAPMPRYPGAREYPLAGQLNVSSAAVKMSYFYTVDDPLLVANFYTAKWKAAGHYVTEDITPQGGVVAAYDPAKGILRQILMRRQGARTMVFPSLQMQPVRPLDDQAAVRPDVPVYPGSEGILNFGARDPGHRSQVTIFTNYGGLTGNVDFYRIQLPERGWREVRAKAAAPLPADLHATLTFHKGRRELTVNITQLGKEGRVRVHLAEATGSELGLTPPPEKRSKDHPGRSR